MAMLDRQAGDSAFEHPLRNILERRLGEEQLAERVLDRDLPGTGGREEQLVVGALEDLECRRRELLGSDEHPQPAMGVEEDLQPSKSRSRSSGKGASKSPGTSNRPRSIPSARRLR